MPYCWGLNYLLALIGVKTIQGAVMRFVVACSSLVLPLGLSAGESKQVQQPTEKTALDLLSYECDYGMKSDFKEKGGTLGGQDVLYNNFSYGHRFLISGQWYFRAGVKYERYDFGGNPLAPVPTKLQTAAGVLAVEYVEQGFAGAALELYPGEYFQDKIHGSGSFDIPWDIYSAFIIRDKKLYGMIGASGALNNEVPIIPIAGVIWLTSDKTRAELIFPKTSLIYNPNDNWEWRMMWELTGGGYRLDENSNPDLNRAVVQYWDQRASVQATYSGFKPFNVVLGVGYIFNRTFDYFRVHQSYTTEGTPFVRFSLGAQF